MIHWKSSPTIAALSVSALLPITVLHADEAAEANVDEEEAVTETVIFETEAAGEEPVPVEDEPFMEEGLARDEGAADEEVVSEEAVTDEAVVDEVSEEAAVDPLEASEPVVEDLEAPRMVEETDMTETEALLPMEETGDDLPMPAATGTTFFDDLPSLDDFDLDTRELPPLPDLPEIGTRLDRVPERVREVTSQPPHRTRIEFRRARIAAEQTGAVRAAEAGVEAARTDEARRRAREEYYTLLFNEIARANPDLAQQAETSKKEYLGMLTRHRVQPSQWLDAEGIPAIEDEELIEDVTVE